MNAHVNTALAFEFYSHRNTDTGISMRFEIAPIFCRPWTLNGITARLIESHYENNYGGAVSRLNAIARELEEIDRAAATANVIHRLKAEEAAALNSALLHEL